MVYTVESLFNYLTEKEKELNDRQTYLEVCREVDGGGHESEIEDILEELAKIKEIKDIVACYEGN